MMSESAIKSSGNVFVDLGYSPDEAAILQMRSDLMAKLRKFIKTKKLTQSKAAKMLGVSQSRVSDLARGKWEKFSLEMLIILATKAGMRVTLKTAA
jgi:predicted XRE-type DNA-binding protein